MPPHDLGPGTASPFPVGNAPALPTADWNEAQEQTLRHAAGLDGLGLVEPQTVHNLAGALAEEAVSSLEAAVIGLPGPGAITSLPGGEQEKPRGFWFKVDAELVIYGTTEPGAQVTLAGHPIELRPDGSFSLRIAFPDGVHELSLAAHSADGQVRRVRLALKRATETGS